MKERGLFDFFVFYATITYASTLKERNAMPGQRNCKSLFIDRWEQDFFVCVGIDPDPIFMPEKFTKGISIEDGLTDFSKAIIDATHDLVCAYKFNRGFFGRFGAQGSGALKRAINYIKAFYPEISIILDVKYGDTPESNQQYALEAFEEYGVDAVTVNPYLGGAPLAPFFERKDKIIFVLCHTSNEGAEEFQRAKLASGEELYLNVARTFAEKWNENNNCGLVVGATYPEVFSKVREVAGDLPILAPGIGKQRGDLASIIKNGLDSYGHGLIINSSSSIMYASSGSDFAERARTTLINLHKAVSTIREVPRAL